MKSLVKTTVVALAATRPRPLVESADVHRLVVARSLDQHSHLDLPVQ